MYFSSIQEIRDTLPKAVRALTYGKRTIDFLPLEDVFIISKPDGTKTRKTLAEMEALEISLESKKGLLKEVKKKYFNKISWI